VCYRRHNSNVSPWRAPKKVSRSKATLIHNTHHKTQAPRFTFPHRHMRSLRRCCSCVFGATIPQRWSFVQVCSAWPHPVCRHTAGQPSDELGGMPQSLDSRVHPIPTQLHELGAHAQARCRESAQPTVPSASDRHTERDREGSPRYCRYNTLNVCAWLGVTYVVQRPSGIHKLFCFPHLQLHTSQRIANQSVVWYRGSTR